MKKAMTYLAVLCVLLACVCFVAIPASASVTEDLFSISETRNMAIRVDYDTAPPAVSFIDPTGKAFGDEAIQNGEMTRADSGEALFFRIPNAAAGQWKVVYDKGSNAELKFTWGPYGEAITLQDLAFTVDGNRLEASFTASADTQDKSYSYTVFAALVDENGAVIGKKELKSGTGQTNRAQEVSVSLGDLATYSNYRLLVEVKADSNGIEVFDSLVSSETFSHTDSGTPQAPEGLYVEVGVTDSYIRADWSEYREYGDGYLLSIYTENNTEPDYYAELESSETAHEVLMELVAGTYRVELRCKSHNGKYSEPITRVIDMGHQDDVQLDAQETTSASQLLVKYNFSAFADSVKTIVSVGDHSEELQPQGTGSFSVDLEPYQNDVSVLWYTAEDVAFRVSTQVYSDRNAPILQLYELTSDTVETEKSSYILAGTTTVGCTVTVGGQTVTVNEDGSFTVTLPLSAGLNEFTVIAISPTGNSAQQTFTVERAAVVIGTQADGSRNMLVEYLPLMLSAVFGLLLCGHILLSIRIARKKREQISTFAAVKTIVGNSFVLIAAGALVAVVWSVIGFVQSSRQVGSVTFYEAASQSVVGAYEMLETYRMWQTALLWSVIALAAAIALAVTAYLLPARRKSKAAAQPESEVPPVTQEALPAQKVCPACHAVNEEDSMFCAECGAPLNTTE